MEIVENKVCLDTDFLIDLLRNKKETLLWIKENEDRFEFATTIINVFELYYGEYKNNFNGANELDKFINSLSILNLTEEIVKSAGKTAAFLESEGNSLDLKDILIGIIAMKNDFAIKTNNKKHFERIKGLELL